MTTVDESMTTAVDRILGKAWRKYELYRSGDRVVFKEPESSTVGYGKGKVRPPRIFISKHLTAKEFDVLSKAKIVRMNA